jgi:hypothetical protein
VSLQVRASLLEIARETNDDGVQREPRTMLERIALRLREGHCGEGGDCLDIATLAIEALREPTRDMLDAARDNASLEDPALVWRDMIDAILEGK